MSDRSRPHSARGSESAGRESVACPGCRAEIDVTRQGGTPLIIERDETPNPHSVVRIRIGRVEVHRCTLSADGSWR